jgi:hypothetical protein
MLNKYVKYAIISILCVLTILPIAFCADAPATPQQQISVQQFVLAVQKQNDQLRKDLMANQDENFKTFDGRMTAMLSGFLRKLVIGLLGGMMVVMLGYAALVNYITNKFTPTFQRNLFRQKMNSAINSGRVVPQGGIVAVESPIVSQREGYDDGLKSKPSPISTFKIHIDEPDFSGINLSSSQTSQTSEPIQAPQKMSGVKKALIYFIIFLFIVLVYLSIRIYMVKMGVATPTILKNITGVV